MATSTDSSFYLPWGQHFANDRAICHLYLMCSSALLPSVGTASDENQTLPHIKSKNRFSKTEEKLGSELKAKQFIKSLGVHSVSSSGIAALTFHWRKTLGASPSVFVCVSQGGKGSAADLRGHATAKALNYSGWNALVVHPDLSAAQRRKLWECTKPEVILFQQTRHPLNDPALYPGIPCVLDVDDADILNPADASRIARIAAGCRQVVVGSRYLAGLFRPHNPNVSVIWTGTYLTRIKGAKPNRDRAPILAWAPSDPFGYPTEAAFVREVVENLASAPAFTFRMYGVPDQQRDRAIALLGNKLPSHMTLELLPPMRYDRFVKSLSEVAVGLQPICVDNEYSLGKSFGKALAYLAADVAIVASNNIDHPLFFRDGVSGRLLDNNVSEWAAACGELLSTPAVRQQLVSAARTEFLARLTTDKAAQLLDAKLRSAITSAGIN